MLCQFLFLALVVQAALGRRHIPPNQSIFNPQPIVRNATFADVDDITDIVVDAWASAAYWRYIFQFRKEYRRFHWDCAREGIQDAVEQVSKSKSDTIFLNVIDAPSNENPKQLKAVSVGAWVLMNRNETSAVPSSFLSNFMKTNCSEHLDLNMTRALHFVKENSAYEERYVEEAYDSQLYLQILGTHPDYDGRGFGAAQCQWGTELAKKRGEQNVTLLATPAGYKLYSTIGFESTANLTFTKVDGGHLDWWEAMVKRVGG